MRNLKACTAIAPVLAAMAAGGAHAETTISTATTTAVKTSTAASGQPDSITIGSAGSITLTAAGAGVTMDSNHAVSNAGTITINNVNDATGILAAAGTSGAITNSGTITLTEDYTATDTDSDGDIDGAFASGARRNGIWIASGAAHGGALTNSGTISIEGNQSAGIRIDSALTGNFSTSGTISVLGDNSYGVIANAVTGNATVRGTISVQGANSVGAAMLGDVSGQLKLQGAITATGYRSTTAPTDTTKLDADDLLQGGPALIVSGNVGGGIIFDKPPTESNADSTDDDNDGITDSEEGTASIIAYGGAPAVRIGAADHAIAIGAVTSDSSGYGIVNYGGILASGVYAGVSSTGMMIGGLGGDVTVAKGLYNAGTISAVSLDSSATGLRIGSGAQVAEISNAGSILASGSSLSGTTASALVIDAGATTTSLINTGAIAATALSTEKGAATGILDSSGGITSIVNKGAISAKGGVDGANIAIDVRANSSGVTFTQQALSATAAAPQIVGDILLGSGNDILSASAGFITGDIALGAGNDSAAFSGATTVTGDMSFGAGTASLSLADSATLTGNVDFGGTTGASVMLAGTSVFTGQFANSAGVALNVASGTFDVNKAATVDLASINVGASGILGVTIDASGNATLYNVSGAASFTSGSQVKVRLSNVSGAVGDYVILRAGSLSGTPALAADSTVIPYMFKGAVSSDTGSGQVSLSIAAKSTTELGLNGSASRAFGAVFKALDSDAAVAGSFLSITDGDSLRSAVAQMLPDHAGGTFEAVTAGSRATARILSDPGGIARTDGGMGFWLQQVAFGGSKSVGDTASYDVNGWGVSGGAEKLTGLGAFGLSLNYLHGTDAAGGNDNEVTSNQYEIAAHWRGNWGPLQAQARLSAAQVGFKGVRRFVGDNIGTAVTRVANGDWDGQLYSATAGVSYEFASGRWRLRPAAGVDYYRLKEDGYTETGGGDAFNLIVASRTSDETTANGSMTVGYELGGGSYEDGFFRIEAEGGRRQIIGGSIGDTIANFKNGETFTLVADDRTNGWTGRLRALGGGGGFRLAGEFSAEQQQSHVALAFRASLSFAM
ncbi:autotransporter outer membrane beta-barrel domain-containing protein [Sphingobium aquiterrae]|uniref:autotransporter outer membrane beta-barrel domain-containing protein n=1 Tax=Sphingobium aquiterrae TaxID=2038656 RepID=UPI003017A51F